MNPDALATLHAHLLTALATPPTETRRLFHGRGRCWPGLEQLTVDWLQGVVLVALFKEPEAAHLDALKQLLVQFEWAQSGAHTVALQQVGSDRSGCSYIVVGLDSLEHAARTGLSRDVQDELGYHHPGPVLPHAVHDERVELDHLGFEQYQVT